MIEEGCISTSAVYDDGIASIELIKLSGSLSKNNMIGVIDCIYLSKLGRTVSPFPPQLKKRGSIHPYRTRERKCVLIGTWARVVNKSGEIKPPRP